MRQWKPRQSLRFAATIAIVGLACSGPSLPSGSGGAPDYTFADRIVFSRYCCALYSAFVIHPDGTGLRPLLATPGNVDVSSYSVSPDGKRVALTESAYQFDAIHIVDSVGHSDTRFPADHATSYAMPRWSPDGTRIAFTESWNASMTVGPDSSRHVLVALADGSGAIVIGDCAILGSGVAWSADGQRVIYSRIGKLVEVNADGSTTVPRVIANTDSAFDPAVSPDGTKILYARISPDAGPGHLAIVGIDGSGPALITNGPDRDWRPAWSPDGLRIVFERDPDPMTNTDTAPILGLINADGSGYARLNTGEAAHGQFAPTWGPATH